DLTYSLVNNVDLYFIGGKIEQCIGKRLDRTIHVSFHNHVQFLESTDGQTTTDFIKCNMLFGPDFLLTLNLLTFSSNFPRFALCFHAVELISSLWCPIEAQYRYRC